MAKLTESTIRKINNFISSKRNGTRSGSVVDEIIITKQRDGLVVVVCDGLKSTLINTLIFYSKATVSQIEEDGFSDDLEQSSYHIFKMAGGVEETIIKYLQKTKPQTV